MKNVMVLALFLVVGCASPQMKLLEQEKKEAINDEKIVEESKNHILKLAGPDGTEHILVKCFRPALCYKLSTKACGTYQIVHSFQHTTSGGDDKAMSLDTSLSMLVKCGTK